MEEPPPPPPLIIEGKWVCQAPRIGGDRDGELTRLAGNSRHSWGAAYSGLLDWREPPSNSSTFVGEVTEMGIC